MSRDKKREETHARVIAAADDLMCTKGFAATTIRDIALEAGVSVGTVMAVGDKNTLLVQVFEHYIRMIHAGRTPVRSADPVAELLSLVAPFVELFISRIDLARTYGGIIVMGGGGTELFGVISEQLISEFQVVLAGNRAQALACYHAYVGIVLTLSTKKVETVAELMAEIEADFRTITGKTM